MIKFYELQDATQVEIYDEELNLETKTSKTVYFVVIL